MSTVAEVVGEGESGRRPRVIGRTQLADGRTAMVVELGEGWRIATSSVPRSASADDLAWRVLDMRPLAVEHARAGAISVLRDLARRRA